MSYPSETELLTCVEAAVAAPSLHNSQPWRFAIRPGGIDVYADRRHQLTVVDPLGREMVISLGAAVLNLRLAIHQSGWLPLCEAWPDPDEPDLVARVRPGPAVSPDPETVALAAAIPRRHTNRRPFERVMVPTTCLDEMAGAASAEGAVLSIADTAARSAILDLARTAELRLRAQGRYRAELASRTMPGRTRRDPVRPQPGGAWNALETMPLRDFGLTMPEPRRHHEELEPYPTVLVLSTAGDEPDHWLRAGQAMQRVLLVATVHGLVATPTSRPLELPELRDLITARGSGMRAQLVLRVGYGQPAAASGRRPLADLLVAAPEPDGRPSPAPHGGRPTAREG
jgi:nitroreductase